MLPRTAARVLGTASRVVPSSVAALPTTRYPSIARQVAPALAAADSLRPALRQRRELHASATPANLPLFVGLGVGASAIGLKYVLEAYPKWKATREVTKAAFRSPYKGGFEEEMTRREAALILGVRESADPKRIKDRHRKLLMANHPDAGGSTFLATKLNEAKDVLLGKR